MHKFLSTADVPEVTTPLSALEDGAEDAGKAWSGSWIGYHALVYYAGLLPPPAGASFSVEWGLMGLSRRGSRGEWRRFTFEEVNRLIRERAGNPDLSRAEEVAASGTELFRVKHDESVSILHSALSNRRDAFLEKLLENVEKLQVLTSSHFIGAWQPKHILVTRDTGALAQGLKVPPHLDVLSHVRALQEPARGCKELATAVLTAASHLERLLRNQRRTDRIGTNVFIGHGRSFVWRDLKDFVSERLRLPWDEFNRVPVAGVTNIARLSEMLDAAAIAFIIMTAEDEQADGTVHARLNAVHEVGLFQGRLGFSRAIVLIEDGCEEFANIQGLGQIQFPKGNIKPVLEEIRRVMEREGLIET